MELARRRVWAALYLIRPCPNSYAPCRPTLSALAGANTEVLLAAGRNRQAADSFFAHAAAEGWAIALVDRKNLDPLFQSPEIDVWRLRRAG